MPDFSIAEIVLLVAAAIAGIVAGWILRGKRAAGEQHTINAGWQHQIDALQSEGGRLAEQNTSLMQQISQYQASNKDAKQRARELSDAFRKAGEQRDKLQRQIKEIRSNLEVAIAERNSLKSNADTSSAEKHEIAQALKEKDDRIARLKNELSKWQSRVPPLVERFRVRNLEAQELAVELERAQARIAELETPNTDDETHMEPVSQVDLPAGLDASNDQYEETAQHDLAEFEDQVSTTGDYPVAFHSGMALGEHDDNSPDDLQRIKGIGPAIEKTLNELGIHRYAQIVSLSEYDINRIADQIRGVRNRMRREDWIGQARLLLSARGLHPA